MKIFLNGIYNFLNFIYDNWTMIMAIAVMAAAIVQKVIDFSKKSREERIEIAKSQISVIMLKLVTKAEKDYLNWVKAGGIKRAEVIDEVFAMYPILSKVTNQAEIIAWIDGTIDEALKTMRKIFEDNNSIEQDVDT